MTASLYSKDTWRAPMAREGRSEQRDKLVEPRWGRRRDDQRADSGTEISRRQTVSNHQPIRDQGSKDASWTSGWIKRNAQVVDGCTQKAGQSRLYDRARKCSTGWTNSGTA